MSNIFYREYKHAKSNFRQKQDEAIKEYEDQVYKDIDEAAEVDIRLFWKLISKQKKRKKHGCFEITFNGETFRNPDGIANSFAKYFENLYDFNADDANVLPHVDHTIFKNDFIFEEYFTVYEIEQAIKLLKLRKAPGHDLIQNEHFKYGGVKLAKAITHLFNGILRTNYIPEQWSIGTIVPLYKGPPKPKGDPNSYRAISLLPCMYKLYEKVLLNRIQKWLKKESIPFPSSQQQGFQENKGCITASFNLHETVLHNQELGSKVFIAFADISKAYDTVLHHGLMYFLKKTGYKG